jgi:hypothetical protein
MIRVYADFNDRTPEGGYWILQHDGTDIDAKASELGLSVGDHILLYQDDDDFEVVATLDFRFVDAIGHQSWVAYPDWSTVNRENSQTSQAPHSSLQVAKRKVA